MTVKKIPTLLLLAAISLLSFAETASAATTWIYRVQPSGVIRGGKLKLAFMGGSKGARNIRFKWKIDSIVGERKDWIPLRLPAEVFDRSALAGIAPGTSARIGSVEVICERPGTYRTQISGIPFRFTLGSGSVWRSIELTVQGRTIRGSFSTVADE
jgi:hypothetical protein